LTSTICFATTHNFNKVFVSKDMTLQNVKMVCENNETTLYHGGKKMDERYSVVSCRKPEGYCLIERKDKK
jgi:hypothetical protein